MSQLAHEALEVALSAAREASDVVMSVYATSFDVMYKGKDDPVTRADHEANALLCERLARAFPGLPVVAEESDPTTYAGFAAAKAAWFVDPLDGTREFVARNGEFAVMIGLAQGGRATLGVIVAPAWKRAFAGVVGEGAWEVADDGARKAIHVTSRDSLAGASMVVSRSRTSAQLSLLLSDIDGLPPTPHGSSGLKAVLVATGVHDVYLQPGPAGMRWDACASEALVRAAGGELTDAFGAPIDYAVADLANNRGLLATNGRLHRGMVEALKKKRSESP
jgi:3'(2'), 5'-bisphosphate nucleotidase